MQPLALTHARSRFMLLALLWMALLFGPMGCVPAVRIEGDISPEGKGFLSSIIIIGQVTEILRRETGQTPDNEAIAARLNGMTVTALNEGDYSLAELVVYAAHFFTHRRLGPEHPETLTSLNNLAMLYASQGRYGEAEPLLQQVLAAKRRVLDPEHSDTLLSLNNLAGLYWKQGRYGEAEPLLQQVLAAKRRVLGPEHPDTLTMLNNLAELYESQGRYGEAEPLFEESLATSRRVLGPEHPQTFGSFNNLGLLYHKQGRYEEAEPLLQQALATSRKVLGPEHPQTLTSLNNLAGLYASQGRYSEAEPLYEEVLAASERVLGPEHPDTLTMLNNLAGLYHKQGRYGEAEPLYEQLLAASRRVLGEEHPDTLTMLNDLAALYHRQGRYGEAEPLYGRALATAKGVLGAAHPRTLTMQINLITNHILQGKFPQALANLARMDGRLQGFVNAQLGTTLSERVRRAWLRSQSKFQHVVFTLATAGFVPEEHKKEAQQLAADVLLRWQRLAEEGEALMARLVRTSNDAELRRAAQGLAAARAKLARHVNQPQPDPEAIATARSAVEEREVALAERSGAFRAHRASRGLDWRRVRAALPEGAALLALRMFQPFNFKTNEYGDPRWLGMVIAGGAGAGDGLIIEDLGPVADMEPAFERLRAKTESTGETRADTAAEARQLYATLFGKLDRELARYRHLYIAPDGLLDLLAFSRLVLPDGRYWVQRQALHRVRGGRDLVDWGTSAGDETPAAATALVAFGGVDYDKFPDGRGADTGNGHAAGGDFAHPARITKRLREEHGTFGTLPATGPEAMTVVQDYRELSNHSARAWYGNEASEGRLKGLLSLSARPPRVLHLATHGFFLEERAGRTERPMTLGGLALAGANRGLEEGKLGPDGEDGVLYAMEARDLNLQGTELVVLSACDTGKGEVDTSEGVYGLTRAFRIAGARNILMTLWPLNDALAGAFMEDFYGNWLSEPGKTPAQALHVTRLAWIEHEDKRKREPRHWAPYVLVE
uniref:Tetratricopeptide repeat-containing protein n=1 Tax=Candidatus Kentrum sp. FM TaxID=2126340 RepID=A0A450SBL1_9GAMM|nr:MAG: Tetratricopeptide repeat-containing protein [Candidatus Kentron sp. FM]VFJ57864.1 MAG: Tetratricopeptide repeat-containing protein [Candidatus Kentron sp. FM]VFK06084.1 MAG: Tetratricopeptide repeat-containing protein [Candidatus Kentron sp. FM]